MKARKTLAAVLMAGIGLTVIVCEPGHAQISKKEQWHRCLLEIYRAKGMVNDAAGEYQALLQINKTDPQLMYDYGVYMDKSGKTSQAVQYYRKASQLNPMNSDYQGALGIALMRLKDYQGAVNALSKAGSKYAAQYAMAQQYLNQLKQIQQYNEQLKKRQAEEGEDE